MRVMGSPAYYPLIENGNNWYDCHASCELILDNTEELVFIISTFDRPEKRRVGMMLPGIPHRPNKTTRLSLELHYVSQKECRVTVRDLGFGEMFPSSGKVWTETVDGKGDEQMSGYILCQTKKAERPYFIENISTNIYSIEELCYYLYHNLYLIDASVINEELCMWIQQELELPKLAAKLRPKLQNYTNAEDVLYPIFKEINYLTYEELKNLNSRMALLNQESPALRQKRKGDCLVENRMYVNAIQVYQKLLEQNPDSERTDFAADVLYNLGCAYSYLFQMEKALECFLGFL